MGLDNYYHDQPLFGLDIGYSSIKVMQFEIENNKQPKVMGYGMTKFAPEAIVNGQIANYDVLSKALYDLFKSQINGQVYTRRVSCSLPTSHTFSRLMRIPEMPDKDISEAIRLEAEQYIPMPVDSLYIDHEVFARTADGIQLLMVATPKVIVDSYIKLLESLDLEPVALEPSVNATSRLFGLSNPAETFPVMLIDLGAVAIDVAVFDPAMIVNSTLSGGSELMTKLVSQRLKIDRQAAFDMRSKYGIGVSDNQQQVEDAILPILDNLLKEVRKITRYYNERVGQSQRKISRIVTSGGGANMPGINEFLSKKLHLPAATLNPWPGFDFGSIKHPTELEQPAYLTVAGAALLKPGEIFG